MKPPVKSRDEIEALLMSISNTPVEIFIKLLNESKDIIRFDYLNDTVFVEGVLEKSLNYLNIINLLNELFEDNESRNIFLCIKFMHKKLCDIFREKGFNENVVLYLAFKLCNYEMRIYENKIIEILEIKDYGLFDENQIELSKKKIKLASSLIKLRHNIDMKFEKDWKVIEAMELVNQISESKNVAEIVQNETPSITTETSINNDPDNNKKEISLYDFLINKSDFDKFLIIQNNFKQYEGKRLAILIHLLQNEYRILNIISKSKTLSRKHFIRLFKEDNSFDKMFAINKYIDSFSNVLILTTAFEFDADYVDIKEKLKKIIENSVA